MTKPLALISRQHAGVRIKHPLTRCLCAELRILDYATDAVTWLPTVEMGWTLRYHECGHIVRRNAGLRIAIDVAAAARLGASLELMARALAAPKEGVE